MNLSVSPKSRLFIVVTVFLPLASLLATGTTGADKAKTQGQGEKYTRPTDPSLYVGEETCKTCHADMPSKDFVKNYESSPHFVTTLDTKKGPEWHGCEACHGPGKAHVEGGGDKTKIFTFKGATAQEVSARCLDCHQYGEEHSNYARSVHLQNGVSCIDCHDPHHPKESQLLLKQEQPALCYGCHLDKKQQFNRPFHHRVNEGLVKCTDCHNPHGGFLARQLKATATQDQVCFTCHTDKAGPFVYEHESVKIEGCTVCHMPHGSSNPRLLKRAQVNLLCLECHAFSADQGGPLATPTFHNQAQKYQACTMCHMAIHGSNSNKFFFTP
ncbi:MAG TPA: DmsE family decaheme c-type cytochrome [Candidatus Methylomirabilis sp.]|nr:DmsE family decaheme c-type cytochrome [Candidatus Methylomirabilis sp.]